MVASGFAPGDEGGKPRQETILHATCVAVRGRGLLITGASGSGKSSLALEMMAFGATLVADDRVRLALDGGTVLADVPPPIHGLIEARGIGLLRAEATGPVPVVAVLALGTPETDRLPPSRETELLGRSIPLLYDPGNRSAAAALMQFLKDGRDETR